MKKLSIAARVAVSYGLVVALAGCGGGGGDSASAGGAPPPVAATATVNAPSATVLPVNEPITLTWSNTANAPCVGTGLLSGITAPSGTLQTDVTAVGQATYAVTCGGASSQTVTLTVLPQYTKINDPVFEQALVSIGADDAVDGQVLTSHILNVTHLAILSGSGYALGAGVQVATTGSTRITDLTGLENFRNLTYLRIEGQAFPTVDLSTLTQLQALSLWQAPITSIDLSHNTLLQTLGISETGLTSVDLTALVNLSELDAQNSGAVPYVLPNGANVQGLTALNLSTNVALKLLYASYNRLTSLDLSHNTTLTEAQVDHNQLASLVLGDVIESLDTQGNSGLAQITSAVMTNASCAADTHCLIDPTTTFVAGS